MSNSPTCVNGVTPSEVFIDFDGTILEIDSQELLMRRFAGDQAFRDVRTRLNERTITVREALDLQVRSVRDVSVDQVVQFLLEVSRVDETFATFIRHCDAAGIGVCILSAGMRPVIEGILNTLALPKVRIIAAEIEISSGGWRMLWPDNSDNGVDKTSYIRFAKRMGRRVALIGNGVTDYEAALEADDRFARRGDVLERMLLNAGVEFTSFARFAELSIRSGAVVGRGRRPSYE